MLDDEQLVVFAKFTEAIALLLRRDDTARSIEVKHSCAKRRNALAESLDRLDRILRNDIAESATALDFDFAEVHFKVQLDARTRLQDDFDHFGFAVHVARHVKNLATGLVLAHVVILVASHAADVEALDVSVAVLAILVDDVIDMAFVVFVELFNENDILTDKVLVADLHDLEAAVGLEHDQVIVFRHVEEVFFLLHARAHETFLAVHVKLLVCKSHVYGVHLTEFGNLCAAFLAFAVLLQDVLEVVHGVIDNVFLVVLAGRDAFFEFLQKLVGLFAVVMAYAADRNFNELADFFVRNGLAVQTLEVRREAFANEADNLFTVLCLLDDLVDFLLDKDFFERGHVPLVFEVLELVGEFPFQKLHGVFRVELQDVRNTDKFRVLVDDDARAWRKRFFAVRKRIKCVNGHLRVRPRLQVYENFDALARVVVHVLDLDFSLVVCFDNAFNQAHGRCAVRDFADGERLVIDLFNLRADLDLAPALTVVVVRHVDDAAREKVRVKRKLLAAQAGDASFAELAEVVGEDGSRETDGDTIDALCQKQRELDRERDRFFTTAIVTRDPFRRFGVEHDIDSERREAAFDITGCCSAVARVGVTPVTLGVDKQILLTETHKRIANGRVTMRVVSHRSTDNRRHLLVASVVVFEHGMQNTALDRLQAIFKIRDRTVQNHIAGVIEEPAVIKSF